MKEVQGRICEVILVCNGTSDDVVDSLVMGVQEHICEALLVPNSTGDDDDMMDSLGTGKYF